MTSFIRISNVMMLLCLLTACGQTGNLYLPDTSVTNNVATTENH